MAKQFSTLSLFLLCLLAFQEMIPGEAAAICSAPSRVFRGLCFRRSNCSAICEKEGFLYGLCKGLKCVCFKDCNNASGGGSSGGDGGQAPPEQGGGDGGDGGQSPPEQGGGDGGDQPPSL